MAVPAKYVRLVLLILIVLAFLIGWADAVSYRI
jgi:hypothetical protein